MKRWRRTCLRAGLLVVAAVLLVGGSASANRLSANYQDAVLKWNDSSQRLTFEAGGNTVECEVTISGSFHELTMPKTANLLIGHATSASVDSAGCVGGTASALTGTLPWHLRFSSFTGTLPRITSLYAELVGARFLIRVEGAECISVASAVISGEASMNSETGAITGFTVAAGEVGIDDLSAFAFICDAVGSGEFSGTASMEDGSGWLIVIRLI
jgi:hypothetical protein